MNPSKCALMSWDIVMTVIGSVTRPPNLLCRGRNYLTSGLWLSDPSWDTARTKQPVNCVDTYDVLSGVFFFFCKAPFLKGTTVHLKKQKKRLKINGLARRVPSRVVFIGFGKPDMTVLIFIYSLFDLSLVPLTNMFMSDSNLPHRPDSSFRTAVMTRHISALMSLVQ